MGVFSLGDQGNSQIWSSMALIPFFEIKNRIRSYLMMYENLTSSVKNTLKSLYRKHEVHLRKRFEFCVLAPCHLRPHSTRVPMAARTAAVRAMRAAGLTNLAWASGAGSGAPPGRPPSKRCLNRQGSRVNPVFSWAPVSVGVSIPQGAGHGSAEAPCLHPRRPGAALTSQPTVPDRGRDRLAPPCDPTFLLAAS